MRYKILFPVVALAVAAAACDQGTGPAGARANTRFLLSQTTSGASASVVALADGSDGGGHGNSVPPSAVQAINVHVTGVAALPLGNDSLQDRDWVHLSATPRWLNLLALPTKADSGLQVARGNLPAGTYGHLRLLFDSANIVFAQTVTLGHGNHVRTFFADSTYKLFAGGFDMPDDEDEANEQEAEEADHFGIVIPATTFTVANDSTSTITIVFNAAQSLQRVLVTGKGLRIQPIMGAAREDEHESEAEDSASDRNHNEEGHGDD